MTRTGHWRWFSADDELGIREEQVGVEFERQLLGIFGRIDLALGLGIADRGLEPADPFTDDLHGEVPHCPRVCVHLGRACEQAWLFGANLVFAQHATALRVSGSRHVVEVADGREISARAVVLAIGVTWRRLGIERLEALIGAGVFYGAAASEARAMSGRHVCVVGGGNSAGQAAAHVAKFADQVTLLVRGGSLQASMSEYLIAELSATPNVSVRLGVQLVDGEGEEHLQAVLVRDRSSGALERIATTGLFVMIGAEPHTEWLDGTIERDESGFLLTGPDLDADRERTGDWALDRAPALFETSVPGVFAAGDVRHGSVKRVTTAMGEGATVIQLVNRYLAEGEDSIDAPALVGAGRP